MGGFAVGQLFWGVVSDAVGRKKPILFSLFAFSVATFMCMVSPSVEFMYVARFLQAFFGCAPVVISRAVITDSFPSAKILFAFSVLAVTQGIAPMVGPIMGNTIREYFPWRYIFGAVGLIGVASFLITWFLLKETNKNRGITGGFFKGCISVLAKASFFVSAYCFRNLSFAIFSLFAAMFFWGELFPLTTNLALKPFADSNKSGTASAIFGFSQLGSSFLFTIILNKVSGNPLLLLPMAFLGCSVAGVLPYVFCRKAAQIVAK